MQPIYFGRSGHELFGVYHPPLVRRARPAAVLVCCPAVQEYMRTHWALRKLAGLLAREGAHVLRFDYRGTGDSSGEGTDGSVDGWVADVVTAAAELRDLSDVPRPSVVGLRLGAAIAVLATRAGLAVRDLVLWEPAVDGASHLRELEGIERVRYDALALPTRSGPEELFGYPLPRDTRVALERVDLRTAGEVAAERILIVAGGERPEHAGLQAGLRDRGGRPPEVRIAVEDGADGHDGVLLSSRAQEVIAAAVAGGGA